MNTILHPTIISNLQHLPLPVDDVGAIADLKKWGATSGDVRAHHIAEAEEGRLILMCIFGNSPYLANCVTHESSCLIDCLFDGVDTVFNRFQGRAAPAALLGRSSIFAHAVSREAYPTDRSRIDNAAAGR